ncbi:ABC transporter ATP-binding protein [Quisquiliibacterium transsilvanicum]|uniref:Phospholipid/cholesterol/gamma-HCH transport system ATP-binding protein n=1 Tax=Quisquiliibacterium transsilvanicum TaxID=1549638 RepID=A0A7W8MA10_9BURK|nr:ATP-binding cassette domain-containing protein [Quisquiliibacterium transsilvanicum]MBB5273566.1 phospholipid/cholesterol/gamma-HCH transport system ATP-binding protein [Quisquiliibacterium transsilvanicum]
MSAEAVIEVEGLRTRIGSQQIHDGLDLRVRRGELVALIGGSGTGKTVLLREMIGLMRPSGGTVRLLGTDVWSASEPQLRALRRRVGVMFQDGALFSSLDVAANVATPLREHTDLPEDLIDDLVGLRIALAGLPPDAAHKMPSMLSGGMKKRAAIARALALEPELLFLDEPTSGLDPVTARSLDRLLRFLCDDLGITVLLVTHDLDTVTGIVDRVIALGKGRVLADGTLDEVRAVDDPWIRDWFAGTGIRAAHGG